eukprot:CAMPEP_0176208820 /NCGR_PEP_ID=MMETSP0121_2-20121125/13320_1 /TAXON_ID=160619 /ORGANISM="Kryptoperidinium foliaceum, Strain CCMP 1326" /LENGTH=236 /DNA_ID=CAMNT_0017547823 /DNA_START=29 /DNA_END=739 /DNA_ORIENTATION=-
MSLCMRRMVVGLRHLVISAFFALGPLCVLGARNTPGDDEMLQEILGLLAEEPVAKDAAGHVQSAVERMSPAAVKAMFEHFLLDAHPPCGTRAAQIASMRRHLRKEVLLALPQVAVGKLLRLDRVETMGELCHWLAVRLLKMPWVDMLRRKKRKELRHMLLEAGTLQGNTTQHRSLMARILRAMNGRRIRGQRDGAPDVGILRRLLDQELDDDRQHSPVSGAVGYIDECPEIVREEV